MSATGPRRRSGAVPIASWLGFSALVLVLVGFAVWSVRLVIRAEELRRQVELDVGRLQRVHELRRATAAWLERQDEPVPDAWSTAADSLAHSVDGATGLEPVLAAIATARERPDLSARTDLVRALDGVTARLRGDNGERSVLLGEAWADLSFVVFTSLLLAGLVVALVVLAELRRRQALRLADEISETAEALAATRAALSAEQAVARLADELRVARDRAEAASAAKTRFMATMSHELLTPLNIILGYAALLRDRCEEPSLAELTGDVVRLESAGHSLFRLLRHVLDLSDLDSGAVVFAREELRLTSLLAQVVDAARPAAERVGCTLTVAAPAELCILGDRGRLATVIAEVVDNACRFAPGGRVVVRALAEPGGVRVEVEDDGPGMRAEELEQATTAFYQADGSRTRAHDGAGLGLTVAARLSARMGGALDLRSAPGQGTTVTIRVPARPPGP